MSWFDGMRYRLRRMAFGSRACAESGEQLRGRIEGEAHRHVGSGMTGPETMRRQKYSFGAFETRRKATPASRGFAAASLGQDVRHGFRSLRRSPRYTISTVLMLGVGIGFCSVAVSMVDSMTLKPYPGVTDGERLVQVSTGRGGPMDGPAWAEFVESQNAFQSVGAVVLTRASVDLGAGPILVSMAVGRGEYFATMQFEHHLGRQLSTASEDDRSVEVSHRFWRNHLGSAPVIGRTLLVNGEPFTVVGVQSSRVVESSDIWVTETAGRAIDRSVGRDGEPRRGYALLSSFVGRLHVGRSISSTQAELRASGGMIAELAWATVDRVKITDGINDLAEIASLLSYAAALVLGLACTNAGLLLVGRSLARKPEIAIRFSLGASSDRVLQQLLVEGVVVATLAAMFGLLLLSVVASIISISPVFPIDLAPSGTTVAVTLGLSALVGVAFSFGPVLNVVDGDLRGALASCGAGPGVHEKLVHKSLILIQFAVASGTTYLCANLLESARIEAQADRAGEISSDRLLAVEIAYDRSAVSDEKAYQLAENLMGRLRSWPEVESVAFASSYPGGAPASFLTLGTSSRASLREVRVGPGYFVTLNLPLLQGRDIESSDRPGSPPVVVVSEDLANDLWPGGSAVGQRLEYQRRVGREIITEQALVVGIAPAVPVGPGRRDSTVYAPALQGGQYLVSDLVVFTRSRGNSAEVLSPRVRQELTRVSQDLALRSIQTTSELYGNRTADDRRFAYVAILIGIVAVGLATTGIFGSTVLLLTQRRREIAIRRAVGGSDRRVIGGVLKDTLSQAGTGGIAGIASGFLASRIWGDLNVLSLGMTAALLGILATAVLFSTLVPSIRVIRSQPIEMLRV